MAIKVKPNTPVTRNKVDGLKMLLFGKPNIGKTTFASSFPNAIVLSTSSEQNASSPMLTTFSASTLSR